MEMLLFLREKESFDVEKANDNRRIIRENSRYLVRKGQVAGYPE